MVTIGWRYSRETRYVIMSRCRVEYYFVKSLHCGGCFFAKNDGILPNCF